MASIRVTSMDSFEDATGTLVLVHPDDTPRPVNYWSVPRWWGTRDRTIYEHCARVDDTANNKSIYISSSTGFPQLLIEESGGNYTFDSDKTREHVNRIFVTSDPLLQAGEDYQCPLRRGVIAKVDAGGAPPPVVEELKFDQQPLLTGTAKLTKVVSGALGTAQGGVPPYDIQGRYRYRVGGAGDWIYLTEFSYEDPQELTIEAPLAVGDKLNFFCRIEDAAGTVKQTGSSKTILET